MVESMVLFQVVGILLYFLWKPNLILIYTPERQHKATIHLEKLKEIREVILFL